MNVVPLPFLRARSLLAPLAGALSLATAILPPGTAAAAPVSFTDDIRPLFNKQCVGCHGGVKKAGQISYLFRDDALAKGKSGQYAIVPGKPEESNLLRRVLDHADPMPPAEHGPMLTPAQVDLLRRWIAEGAKWEGHWAFEKPARPAVPAVKNTAWPRGDLDRFVLARLETEGLAPEPEQDRARWLRRVSLDLIGLPPSPAEVDAFVAETSPDAATRAVDRLLRSPHFGERWAALWLDLVRYADSKGLGQDQNREIWKYRDWVIDAFNRDLPFDEFTLKQLAGDLLPDATVEDRIATACHRNTATNDEGGTDDEEFRIEAVIDRVNTTWQVWQGVTFGCVQCHAHPYDPFKQEEYYKFLAVFNQSRDVDTRPDHPLLRVPLAPADYPKATALDREITALRRSLHEPAAALAGETAAWTPLRQLKVSANKCGATVESRDGREEFRLTGTVPRGTRITIEVPVNAGLTQFTALRLDALPLDPAKARQLTEWGFVLNDLKVSVLAPQATNARSVAFKRAFTDELEPFLDPQDSIDTEPAAKAGAGRRRNAAGGFAAFTRIDRDRWGVFVPETPVALPAGSRLRIVLAFDQVAQDAFPLVLKRGHLSLSADPRWTQLVDAPETARAQESLAAKIKERAALKSSVVPVMEELPAHLQRPTSLFIRGNWMTRGPAVTPGVPASFPPLPAGAPADRLGVARWLVGPDNPLTARVLANRLWEQLFGLGLVETLEDFGSAGEKPTHPELLDWLAVRLATDHRWSVKQALREMVLSATYRQDNRVRPDKLARDPRNRLLARGPRQRVTAEMLRDQALAVSGLLNSKLSGPPAFPPLPEGVWDPFVENEKWPTPAREQPDRYRRAIYTHVKRTIPYPTAATFDAPSREVCNPRRVNSNTPVQALTTLNDAVFHEAALALASHMAESGLTPAERIQAGYRQVTGRAPTPETLARLARLETATGRVTTNSLASLQNVAVVLLNLDEVLTR